MRRHDHRLWGLAVLVGILLLSASAAAQEGGGIEILDHHPILRPALPWRVRFRLRDPAPRDRELVVQIALYDAQQIVALHDLDIDDPAELNQTITAYLIPPWELSPQPMTVDISIQGRGWEQNARREVPTYPNLLAQAQQAITDLRTKGTDEPLPWLWAEEIGAISPQPPRLATIERIHQLTKRLQAWPMESDTLRQFTTKALRCRVDGSIQPYRALPGGSHEDPVALVMAETHYVGKHRWRSSAAPWLQTAQEAGCAVVEWYPAGDADWRGMATQRVLSHWQDVLAQQGWQDRPQVVVGIGRGANAALSVARRHPFAIRAVLLIEPRLGPGQEFWPQLEMVPIAVLGSGNEAFERLRRDHAQARDLWLRLDTDPGRRPDPDNLEAWQWLRLRTRDPNPAPPWRFHVDRPGDYGPIRVHALKNWRQAGHLTITAGDDHLQVQADNLLGLQWQGSAPPALMAGQALSTTAPARSRGPSKTLGLATGPLNAFMQDPFTVIIGRGDSAAAARDNRQLARAFLEDWRDHAHGLPPWHDEDDLSDGLPDQGHLVLIGNPLSHRLLGRLLDETRSSLPLTWDALHLHHHDLRLRRGRGVGLALAWPHPRDPSRLLIILDGVPVWTRQQAPLLDLTMDLRLKDGTGRHHDTVFDGRWTGR